MLKRVALALLMVAPMASCSSSKVGDQSEATTKRDMTKRDIAPGSRDRTVLPRATWMNLTTDQIRALADHALSCRSDVYHIEKCGLVSGPTGDVWVDFNRSDPQSFDSINLSFDVSPRGLAVEPLARVPPEPLRLIHFFLPGWRGGAAWLRYAVKHSQGECHIATHSADAGVGVIGQYRYDPQREAEVFVVELRIYPRSHDFEHSYDQCVDEEVTDSTEVRSRALSAGMSIEQAVKLRRADSGL